MLGPSVEVYASKRAVESARAQNVFGAATISVKRIRRRFVSALVLVALVATLGVILLWPQPPVFSLSNSGGISVSQGGSGSNTINVILVSGSAQSVVLAACGLPSGAAAIFSPPSGNPTFAGNLTLTTSPSTPVGAYTITVTGTCGGLRQTTTFTLTVDAPPKWLQPNDTNVISFLDAKKYVGQNKTVEGTIVKTYRWDCPCSEEVLYLQFHDLSRGYFTAAISESGLRSFPFPPEAFYRGKDVRITGVIRLYDGDPEIAVRAPSQIEVAYRDFSYSKAGISSVVLLLDTRLEVAARITHNATIYFNGGCPFCLQYVETLEHAFRSASITDIRRYDYQANSTVFNTLSSLRQKLGVPEEFFGAVTTIIDGKYIFEGYFPIEVITSFLGLDPSVDRLISAQGLRPDTYRLLKDELTLECPSSRSIVDCLSSGAFLSVVETWTLVLVSGFVNGLNPCALLAFVYFVGVVSINRSRKEILMLGAPYVLSIYFLHLGMGIGLMRAVLLSGYIDIVSKAFGIVVILLAILGLKNAFRHDSAFPLKIPKSLISPIARRFSHSWIQKSTLGATLLFGGAVAVLEFPCTSGVYAAVIGMLSIQRANWMPYFLGYNLMFVVPLVILLILSCSIASSSSLREIVEKRKHLLRKVSSLFLLGVGILLLLR